MASSKQLEANKRNAEKSTGPRSSRGKKASSLNSLKHGLLSQRILLPWESSAELAILKEEITNGLQPVGAIEVLLADRIISLTWRLYRVGTFESGILSLFKFKRELDHANANADALSRIEERLKLPLKNKEFEISEHRLDSVLKIVDAMENLNSEPSNSGQNFVEASDSIGNLYRYETAIEKSLYKAIHELQRIQAVRNGNNVPPPIAIDVNGGTGNSDLDY